MRALLLIFFAIVLAAPARGDEREARKPKKVVILKPGIEKFVGLKLKGQLKKPELSYIYKRKGLRAERIVDIPEDFNEEIIQDAEKF
jgi:hypothetical protein